VIKVGWVQPGNLSLVRLQIDRFALNHTINALVIDRPLNGVQFAARPDLSCCGSFVSLCSFFLSQHHTIYLGHKQAPADPSLLEKQSPPTLKPFISVKVWVLSLPCVRTLAHNILSTVVSHVLRPHLA
jgi:hypothetical protein